MKLFAIILIIGMIALYGCVSHDVRSVAEPDEETKTVSGPEGGIELGILAEIDGIKAATMLLYSEFSHESKKLMDGLTNVSEVEPGTAQLSMNSLSQAAKNASDSFNMLLSRINESRQSSLSAEQQTYLGMLANVSVIYMKAINADMKLFKYKITLSAYTIHNKNFFIYFKQLLVSIVELPGLEERGDWGDLNNIAFFSTRGFNCKYWELT